jgi:hemerythrin
VYSIGVPEMDGQHRNLVNLMNRFYDENARGNAASAKAVLESLVNATKAHFAREEALLERCGYPDLVPHKADHAALLGTVGKSVSEYAADPTAKNADGLAKFLRNWLVNHILGTDKRYARHVKS